MLRKAFTLVELLVVIGIIALLVAILLPVLGKAKEQANRVKCASNLQQIGIALRLYADSNKGQYPRTPYDPSMPLTADRSDPWHPLTLKNNVLAPLHLLISSKLIQHRVLQCPSADGSFTVVEDGPPEAFLNFQWGKPYRNLLHYSYANPYPAHPDYPWEPAREYRPPPKVPPNFPVASDRNDTKAYGEAPRYPVSAADHRKWNSKNHNKDGQNVLYNDGHVSWAQEPRCGINGDNIFLVGPDARETEYWMSASPKHKNDCFMVPAGDHWYQ